MPAREPSTTGADAPVAAETVQDPETAAEQPHDEVEIAQKYATPERTPNRRSEIAGRLTAGGCKLLRSGRRGDHDLFVVITPEGEYRQVTVPVEGEVGEFEFAEVTI